MKYEHLESVPKKIIDEAHKAKAKHGIIMTVKGFQTDEEALMLKDLLWYASDKGIEVIFAPSVEDQANIIEEEDAHNQAIVEENHSSN